MMWTSVAGWIGMTFMLIAYFLISGKKVDGQNAMYQGMNLVGAVGLCINAYSQEAWPVLALESVWGGIAFWILVRKKGEG